MTERGTCRSRPIARLKSAFPRWNSENLRAARALLALPREAVFPLALTRPGTKYDPHWSKRRKRVTNVCGAAAPPDNYDFHPYVTIAHRSRRPAPGVRRLSTVLADSIFASKKSNTPPLGLASCREAVPPPSTPPFDLGFTNQAKTPLHPPPRRPWISDFSDLNFTRGGAST